MPISNRLLVCALSLIISSTLVAAEPVKSEPPKNLATRLIRHFHFVVPYYIASVHTPPSRHLNPALAQLTFQVKMASAFAAGEELARAIKIVKSDGAAAHAITGFVFFVFGRDSFFPSGAYIQAAAFNEAGLTLERLIQESGYGDYVKYLSQQTLGAILLATSLTFIPSLRFAPIQALVASRLAGSFALPILKLTPISQAAAPAHHLATGYAATTTMIASLASLLGRGQTRLTVALAMFGMARLSLPRGVESRLLRVSNIQASGMVFPLAFYLVDLSKYFVTSLSWTRSRD